MLVLERTKDGTKVGTQVEFDCNVIASGADLPHLNIELKDAEGRSWQLTPTQEEAGALSTLIALWEKITVNSFASMCDRSRT